MKTGIITKEQAVRAFADAAKTDSEHALRTQVMGGWGSSADKRRIRAEFHAFLKEHGLVATPPKKRVSFGTPVRHSAEVRAPVHKRPPAPPKEAAVLPVAKPKAEETKPALVNPLVDIQDAVSRLQWQLGALQREQDAAKHRGQKIFVHGIVDHPFRARVNTNSYGNIVHIDPGYVHIDGVGGPYLYEGEDVGVASTGFIMWRCVKDNPSAGWCTNFDYLPSCSSDEYWYRVICAVTVDDSNIYITAQHQTSNIELGCCSDYDPPPV